MRGEDKHINSYPKYKAELSKYDMRIEVLNWEDRGRTHQL